MGGARGVLVECDASEPINLVRKGPQHRLLALLAHNPVSWVQTVAIRIDWIVFAELNISQQLAPALLLRDTLVNFLVLVFQVLVEKVLILRALIFFLHHL